MSIYIVYYKSTKVRVKFNKISIKNISFKFEIWNVQENFFACEFMYPRFVVLEF